LLKLTKIASIDISALDEKAVNELIDELAIKIFDIRIAIILQHFFILNLIFISVLVAKI